MTKEEAKEFAEIIVAFGNGKQIQYRNKSRANDNWHNVGTKATFSSVYEFRETPKTVAETFIEFLKENKVYEQFLTNFENDLKPGNISLEEYLFKTIPARFISSAFTWEFSKRLKLEDWIKLDDNWLSIVKLLK